MHQVVRIAECMCWRQSIKHGMAATTPPVLPPLWCLLGGQQPTRKTPLVASIMLI